MERDCAISRAVQAAALAACGFFVLRWSLSLEKVPRTLGSEARGLSQNGTRPHTATSAVSSAAPPWTADIATVVVEGPLRFRRRLDALRIVRKKAGRMGGEWKRVF